MQWSSTWAVECCAVVVGSIVGNIIGTIVDVGAPRGRVWVSTLLQTKIQRDLRVFC
jgi:hypothetical protein